MISTKLENITTNAAQKNSLLKNTTTDAAQCRYAFVVETQSFMISTKVEKQHDRCGPMSLCFRCGNTSMHDFNAFANSTTDAAQCRYAFVVETQSCMISTKIEKHHDRCGPMSLCFRCGNTIMHDFYEF
jgi:DNA-directed RNA polymerase subunit N (RpoN/RPB10)